MVRREFPLCRPSLTSEGTLNDALRFQKNRCPHVRSIAKRPGFVSTILLARIVDTRNCLWAAMAFFLLCPAVFADHTRQLEPVTLQLKWQHQFQFAGYYAAQEKGFYREKGLDVRFVEATPETSVVNEVVSGRAQYGVGNSALLLARQAGNPVVALAVIFQHSPLTLYGHVFSGVSNAQDLRGKRIMLEPNSEELLAFLRREKILESTVQILSHTFSADALILGQADAISGYSTSEPYYLDKSYIPYVALSPRSVGIDFYGDNLFTSEREIADNPKRVKAFREASLKGWEYAMSHTEEMVDIIRTTYTDRHSLEFLRFEAERMKPLIGSDMIAIGYMHSDRWRHIISTYTDLDLIRQNIALNQFLYVSDSEEERKQERRKWMIGLAIAVTVGALASIIATLMLRLNRNLKREIAARAKAVSELQESESKFRFIAENTGDVIWTLDIASGRFTYVSPSVYELRGYTPEEIMAQPMEVALTPESAERARTALEETIARWQAGNRSRTFQIIEIDQPHKDGRIVHTEVVTTLHAGPDGSPAYVIGVTRNVTERRRAEEAIRRLAFYDPLTELANRRLLLDRLPQEIARARRDLSRLAILYIDLDKFKPINDTRGHDTGDWLLKSAATRLRNCLRQSDTAARVGGDEFVALLGDIHSPEHALSVAEKICLELRRPFVTDAGDPLAISSSVGVALFPDDSDDEHELLRMADEAMYHAKHTSRGRVELFSRICSKQDFPGDKHPLIHLAWWPSFASGHPVIDQQHHELFRLANELLGTALTSHAAPEALGQAFDTVLAHIEQHFSDEEKILRAYAYPALPEHITEHRGLVRKAKRIRDLFAKGEIPQGELVDFLARDMVAMHLLQEDRKFFPLFVNSETRTNLHEPAKT